MIKRLSATVLFLIILAYANADADYGSGKSSGPTDPGSSTRGTSSTFGAQHPRQPPPAGTQTFAQRIAAPGVVKYRSWDTAADFFPENGTHDGVVSGYHPTDDPLATEPVLDTTIKAAGAGSIKFTMPSNTGARGAGNYENTYGPFGANETFYVQYQERFSPEALDPNLDAIGVPTFKQLNLYGLEGTSCAGSEITMGTKGYVANLPHMNTRCGQDGFYTTLDRSTFKIADPPYLLQQGDSDTDGYNCPYGVSYTEGTGNGVGCFKYPTNTWVTFYYKMTFGALNSGTDFLGFGPPYPTPLHPEVWVSVNGQPYKRIINVPEVPVYDLSATNKMGRSYLGLYSSQKLNTMAHPPYSVWYDSFIVSTQPIAVPAVE